MPDLKTLQEAAKRGNLDDVRAYLKEQPSLLNELNESGQSTFLLAKYYGQQAVAEYLLNLNPRLDVFTACVAGLEETVVPAVERDPSLLAAHSSDGWTPLHLAAFFGHSHLAAALIDRGGDVDALSTNAMTNTPLHAAVAGRKLAAAQLLLDRGASVNARQHGGWTALHGAAQAGDKALVQLLIDRGADLHALAENHQTPLDLALSRGHGEIATLLEEAGAKLP